VIDSYSESHQTNTQPMRSGTTVGVGQAYGTDAIPTGAALGTSATFAAASLTTSYQLITFTFATPVATVAGTKYFVTVEFSGGSVGNTVDVGEDRTTLSHGGNEATLFGSTWSADQFGDIPFYVDNVGSLVVAPRSASPMFV
jgi:hypothetical protein